jgi:hypothetical protein
MEGPTMLEATLSLANRNPLADAIEIFEGNPARGVFGFRDQRFAETVVHITSESLFLAPTMLQQPFRSLGAFGLQPRTQPGMSMPQPVHLASSVFLAVRVRSNVDDAEVNSKPIMWVFGFRLRNIGNDGQIKYTIPVEQIGLASQARQTSRLIGADDDRDQFTTSQRQDGDAIQGFPGENALIIDNGAVWSKGGLDGLVPLVSFADLGNGADGQLSREPKVGANLMIDELLQFDLVGGAFSERNNGDGITGVIEAFHRFEQRGMLSKCGM